VPVPEPVQVLGLARNSSVVPVQQVLESARDTVAQLLV
jgi:hypothetical protein